MQIELTDEEVEVITQATWITMDRNMDEFIDEYGEDALDILETVNKRFEQIIEDRDPIQGLSNEED